VFWSSDGSVGNRANAALQGQNSWEKEVLDRPTLIHVGNSLRSRDAILVWRGDLRCSSRTAPGWHTVWATALNALDDPVTHWLLEDAGEYK
jgi:hypothetical protein